MTQDLVLKALKEIGGSATSRELAQYIAEHYPGNITATRWIHKSLRALRTAGYVRRTINGTWQIGSDERVVLNYEREARLGEAYV